MAMGDAQPEASTSSLQLPSRKTYLTTLSIVAFVSGLGVATVVTIRRGRKMRLEELRERAMNGTSTQQTQASSVHKSLRAAPPSAAEVDSPLSSASAQNPLALFKEMNRAIFNRKRENDKLAATTSSSPSVLLKHRGKEAKSSVFDSASGSAAPSALMRSPRKVESVQSNTDTVGDMIKERPSGRAIDEQLPAENSEMIESPAIMAVKAIGIATALVGVGAFVAWEIGRRALGVRNMDELIDRLATSVPSNLKEQQALSDFGDKARGSLKRGSASIDDVDIDSDEDSMGTLKGPLSIDEALQALDEAAARGEAKTWMSILSRQLNAERAKDLEERQRRIARQQAVAT